MPVLQQRNQKKTKRRRNTGHTIRQRQFLLDNPIEVRKPSFEEWLLEQRNPGDWLENEYLEEGTFEDRMLSLSLKRNSFFDKPRSFLDNNDDYDPDFGNDFDDLYDPSDFEGEW